MQTATAPDGLAIQYLRQGGGPRMLLLQGLGATAAAWTVNVVQLARRFICLVPDQRGVGATGAPPGPYSTTQMALDAAAILDAEGAAHVVGLSMGGAVAQELALARPELVRSLTLVSSFARADPRAIALTRAWPDLYEAAGPELFFRQAYAWLFSPKFFERPGNLETAITYALRDRPTLEGLRGQCAAVIGHDSSARLGEIMAPTLVMHGVRDLLTPIESARALAAGIPGAQLHEIAGGYHALNLECQAQFNRVVIAHAERAASE